MRLGMVVDLAKCIGCNACVMACKMENETPVDQFNTWIESWDVDDGAGYFRRANLPRQCNHCANPACVAACPTGASYVDEDGTVQIDQEKCIGCDACIAACPYEARYHVDETGTVRKCTFCHHRTTLGMLPACVGSCVAGARVFGDLADPESDAAKMLAAAQKEGTEGPDGVDVLLPESDADPQIYYIGLDATLDMERVSNVWKGGNVKEAYQA